MQFLLSFFHSISIEKPSKTETFQVFAYAYLPNNPRGVEVWVRRLERLLRDLSFMRKDLLERKSKVPHHF